MAVTSFVRDRGRAFGIVIALAMSAALVSAPAAFGAVEGDPIATSTLKVKFGSAFKNQLAQNGVKMKAKGFKISKTLKSDVDPTTGQADLRLGKVVFKKGKNKVVYGSLKGSLPGKVASTSGKLFKLTAPTATRNGFGADISGVKIKLLAAAAKKINKRLELNSLHAGNAGTLALSYQPKTVQVLGGSASTTGATVFAPPSAPVKLLAAHCVNGAAPNGITPIPPATQPGGPAQTLFFPVTGGDIAPDGLGGIVEQSGGVRLNKNEVTAECTGNGFSGELTQTDLQVNITEQSVSSEVNIVSAPTGVGTGPRGRAVGQTLDGTSSVVAYDAANKTFSITGTKVLLAPISAQVLNLVFPNVSGFASNDMAGGDLFGSSTLTVTHR